MHHDRLLLQMALTELESLTHKLNETKRESESRHDVKRVMASLTGRNAIKASASRYLVRQDDMLQTVRRGRGGGEEGRGGRGREGAGVTDGQERHQGERQPLPGATGRHASDGEEGERRGGEGGGGGWREQVSLTGRNAIKASASRYLVRQDDMPQTVRRGRGMQGKEGKGGT